MNASSLTAMLPALSWVGVAAALVGAVIAIYDLISELARRRRSARRADLTLQ
jgi:predicted ferric reductase